MKIAVSANGDNLDSAVERRLHKATFFLIVDSETLKYETILVKTDKENEQKEIDIAKKISSEKVDAILTGLCSDDAFQIFRKSNIMVSETADGKIKEQVKSFIHDWIKPTQNLNNSKNLPFWIFNKANMKGCQ